MGYKSYADSTLRMMKKSELIELIRCLEHNWKETQEQCERQYVILDWCINKGVLAQNLKEINTEILKMQTKGHIPEGLAEKEFKRVSLAALQEYKTLELFKRIVKEREKNNE